MSDTGWYRQVPVASIPVDRMVETWSCRDRGVSFDLDVFVGKPFDVTGLKGADIAETLEYAAFLKESVAALYGTGAELEMLARCPACDSDASGAHEAFRILGVAYSRCAACGHGFVRHRPTQAAMERHFRESDGHTNTYVDESAAQRRIDQIAKPKLDWVIDRFQAARGRRPTGLIDVGAGGGHIVAAAAQLGLDAEGWELAESSRGFARKAFGIELIGEDFLTGPEHPVDLVTMWGLLEYTPFPRQFLKAARRRLVEGQGMLIAEVPRLDALGTLVQIDNPETIARHMDPSSHINCFSDTSLFSALLDEGFMPVAAWYFGMDAYEMLTQISVRSGSSVPLQKAADMITRLQHGLDSGRLNDDIVVAAIPV